MTGGKKLELFKKMLILEQFAGMKTFDGRNYFEQAEGFYKALTILGINKEYIKWSHKIWLEAHNEKGGNE